MRDMPIHVPFTFAKSAFQASSLEAKDCAVVANKTSAAAANFTNISLPFTFRIESLHTQPLCLTQCEGKIRACNAKWNIERSDIKLGV
ncbi:hypothetical protein [Rhizobium sp. P44RR-XXIV]|uniref:hypothetical protein n=1 Tax=Rhizobium sp. P44RR-XXIV TaxID=1921145 RepID=UPI001FEF1E0F|nr:hypothetical protein [Rhizobium sp. P44RR-XXIV]